MTTLIIALWAGAFLAGMPLLDIAFKIFKIL